MADVHSPLDVHFVSIGGQVRKTGGSLNLSQGELALVDTKKGSKDGLAVVTSIKNSGSKNYAIRLGPPELAKNTRSTSTKSWSTFPFSASDVVGLEVSGPEHTEQKVDKFLLGFNGIDPSTSMSFELGDSFQITLELSGDAIGKLGYEGGHVVIKEEFHVDSCDPLNTCEDCDPCVKPDCTPIVESIIQRFQRHTLRGMVSLTDYVKISPVRSCQGTPTEIPYNYFCLEVCDEGDDSALASVRSQYPEYTVVCKSRVDNITTYEVLVPDGVTLSDYTYTRASLQLGKDCDSCPTGTTQVDGTFDYEVSLSDGGADSSATVETLANAVSGSAVQEFTASGISKYSVSLTAELSDASLDTFLAANPTATVEFKGESITVCEYTPETASWTACGTCNVIEETYRITLPDTECGESRLEELQDAYPSLTITELTDPAPAGCQRYYETTIVSNLVCDECDDIYKAMYETEAPEDYDLNAWTLFVDDSIAAPTTDCLCGIVFEGEVLEVHPNNYLADEIGFEDSSVKIKASGGYVTEVREGIVNTEDNPFHQEYLERAVLRTHLGGQMYDYERRARQFFTGKARHKGSEGHNLVARAILGEDYYLVSDKQYVDYALTVKNTRYSNGWSNTETMYITYHFLVEVGKHKDVESMVNAVAIASPNNVTTVSF